MKYLKVYEKFSKNRRLLEYLDVDNPQKADLVDKDVDEFFKTLQIASESEKGIKQQSYGNMTYQKAVESIQIGLLLLGYELPRFGVDGLFGPETAEAVKKFKEDNKDEISEKSEREPFWKKLMNNIRNIFEDLELVELEETDYTNLTYDDDETKHDLVNKALLDDIQQAAENAGVVAKIHFAQHGHPSMSDPDSKSRHKRNIAVDISSIDGEFYGSSKFKEKGDRLKDELVKLGYNWNTESGHEKAVLWQTYTGGNHYNHLHISNRSGEASLPSVTNPQGNSEVVMEPIYISLMIDKLKEKDIKSTDLQRYIDIKSDTNELFTQLDLTKDTDVELYSKICQNFIDKNQPNLLEITGVMMGQSAKKTFDKHGSYIPPELALAQLKLEGGISNPKPNSRPIRTKNPFNVGNTDEGKNIHPGTVQEGIERYYDLIGKSYLTSERKPDDLLKNFVNKNGLRYASSDDYEKMLSDIVKRAKNISDQTLTSSDVQAQRFN